MHTTAITALGLAYRRRGSVPFGIKPADRLLHQYIIGQTGTGKSTLLFNMALEDMRHGQGFCLIDPHGDLASRLAPHLGPKDIYWDLGRSDSPYGYNPMTYVAEPLRPLIASGLIDALKKQWGDSWGVRMEHLLRYAILALLNVPETDLRDIMRLFIDRPFRKAVTDRITDSQVKAFWTDEFPAMNYKTAIDGVAPIANKIGAFLANPVIRTAVCAPKQPLRFRRMMDEGQSLAINLAKGRIGADSANVLGGLVVASLMNGALSRECLPEAERRPFILYVDEFHSFTTLAIATMLAEVRKYGLGVVLAQQYVAQAETAVTDAILGNVGTLFVFRVGAQDAPLFDRQMPPFLATDFMNLKNHDAYVRMLVDGEISRPFSARTWPAKDGR